MFGLHSNATISKDQFETTTLFASILLTQAQSSGGGGGEKSKDQTMFDVAADIYEKLPDNFSLELAQVKYPVKWSESMNTVLQQEIQKYNRLLETIRPSLKNVQRAVKGEVVMSARLEAVGNSLFFGDVPELWLKVSFPSLKKLGSYVTDVQNRLAMFDTWLNDAPPTCFWFPGFFFRRRF